jgi:hypothetical protein
MKPIGRNRKIPYCDRCADRLLIPSLDIARMGAHFEQLPDNLKLAVTDYYESKGMTTKHFNDIVDELQAEWESMVEDYYDTFGEDLKLMEEALISNV